MIILSYNLHTPSCENFLIDQLKALHDQMMLAVARFQVLSPISCVRYSRCLPIGYRSHLGGIHTDTVKPVHLDVTQKLRVQPHLKIISKWTHHLLTYQMIKKWSLSYTQKTQIVLQRVLWIYVILPLAKGCLSNKDRIVWQKECPY